MPDRKAMDRPATVILAVSGLLFIGLSVPFIPAAYCDLEKHNPDLCGDVPDPEPVAYDVTWSAGEAFASPTATLGGDDGSVQAQLNVTGFQGDVTVTVDACDDEFRDPVQEPAMVSLVLTASNGTELVRDAFECTEVSLPMTYTYAHPAPDVGTVEGLNDDQARREVLNRTAPQPSMMTYTLTVSATRGGQVPPIGVLDPTLTVETRFAVQTYAYSVNARVAEVPK